MTSEQTYNVLIAEDDPFLAAIIEQIFSKLKIPYDLAPTARQAIDLYKTNTYNLLLLDMMLPDATGFDISKEVRKEDSETPIIAFTSLPFDEIELQLSDAGIHEYMQKPNSAQKLNDILTTYLRAVA